VGAGEPGYDKQQAVHSILFDVDAGREVAPDHVPAYRPDHRYQLVIDTGLAQPGALHFGVADGNFSDNAGSYTIEVAQLGDARPRIDFDHVAVLMPARHDLVDVSSTFRVSSADGSPTTYSLRVWSDEPEVAWGGARFAPDFIDEHEGGRGVLLRAERQGFGNGRFYIGEVTAANRYGKRSERCVLAVVPHSRSTIDEVLREAAVGVAPFEQGRRCGGSGPR
jgi:hypothetical protein